MARDRKVDVPARSSGGYSRSLRAATCDRHGRKVVDRRSARQSSWRDSLWVLLSRAAAIREGYDDIGSEGP